MKLFEIQVLAAFKVKVSNLWEYLFLTFIAVPLFDHWTSTCKFSKWCSWAGTRKKAVPAPFFRGRQGLVSSMKTKMDRISNFLLNSTRMQKAHYYRDINFYMLRKLLVRGKGVDIAPCPPPKYATATSRPTLWFVNTSQLSK